jgi:hypothetical protein
MWATTTSRNPQCGVCQHHSLDPCPGPTRALRLQMNKLGNRPKIATASLADDSPTVPSGNLAFPIARRAQFPDFQVDDGSSTRTMVKGLILHRRLALFVSLRLPERPG